MYECEILVCVCVCLSAFHENKFFSLEFFLLFEEKEKKVCKSKKFIFSNIFFFWKFLLEYNIMSIILI